MHRLDVNLISSRCAQLRCYNAFDNNIKTEKFSNPFVMDS